MIIKHVTTAYTNLFLLSKMFHLCRREQRRQRKTFTCPLWWPVTLLHFNGSYWTLGLVS